MNRKNNGGWSTFIFNTVLTLAVLIILMQVNNLEVLNLNQRREAEAIKLQIARLARSVDQLQAKVKGVHTSDGNSQSAYGADVKFLHPQVKNFLIGNPPKSAPPTAPMTGVFHKNYGLQGVDPKGMNFVIENSAPLNEDIQYYVNLYLARRDPSDISKWYGDLAHRVEITDDFKEYTIYLKKGVKWHRPAVDLLNPRYKWLDKDRFVTAEDVLFTLELILNPQVQAAHSRNYYQDVESWKAVDDHTVVIRWKKKTYQSLAFTMGLYPTPKWLYTKDEDGSPLPSSTLGLKFNEHWYNNKAIGCGPYRFVEWRQGVLIKLERFDEYSAGDLPPIKEIQYHLIRDKNQQLLNFQSGLLDIHGLTFAQYRESVLEGPKDSKYRDGTYKIENITRMVYRYLGWNLEDYRFNDKRVRRAMTHAFDRRYVIDNVLYGLGTLTTGSFYRHSPAYDTSIDPIPFDLEKAKQLLTEAGWVDTNGDGIRDKEINGERKEFEFPMIIYGYRPEVRSWSTLFKENLYKIGVQCTLVPVEWSVMLKKMEDREFVAYTGGWGLDPDGDPYQIWHSSQADEPKSSNRIGFRNAEADKIIETLRSTFDREERIRLQHKFHRIVHEEQPYTFLYNENIVVANQPWVHNVDYQVIRPHIDTSNWFVTR